MKKPIIKLVISLGIKLNYTEVIIDSGTSCNLIDYNSVKALNLHTISLRRNTFLRSISGERIPVVAKIRVSCTYNKVVKNLTFFVCKYALPFVILGRQGMNLIFPSWKQSILQNTQFDQAISQDGYIQQVDKINENESIESSEKLSLKLKVEILGEKLRSANCKIVQLQDQCKQQLRMLSVCAQKLQINVDK